MLSNAAEAGERLGPPHHHHLASLGLGQAGPEEVSEVSSTPGEAAASVAAAEFYQSGGYWLTSSQLMNGALLVNRVADVVFDPFEELVWAVSKTGQLSAFYSSFLEQYVSTPVPALTPNILDRTGGGSGIGSFRSSVLNFSTPADLRQVMPSPKASEHLVYVLASNGLYAYTKFARLATQATDLKMINLECMAVADLSGSSGVGNRRRHSNGAPTNFSRFFLGGLQRSLLEVDAGPDRWGTPLRSIDVGEAGCVIFRPCTVGLCAANTKGKASDSRAIKYKD